MANAYYAGDYGNTPPQMQQFAPVRRPFNVLVNSGGGSYGPSNNPIVSTLGSGDTIALCTLPGSGSGIIITDWAMSFGIVDTGTHAAAFELGLVLDSLDPGMTSAAAAGFFATGITPGSAGGFVTAYNAGLSSTVVIGAVPYSISDYNPNSNGGQYDLVLQVTTAAGTVSAVNAYIRGWIEYIQISQNWAN